MTAALLDAALPAPPAGRVLVGYSGGLDSRVLLQLAWRRYGAAAVSAIHVHHGLSPNADHWARHCAASCAELGVACHIEMVDTALGSGGPEARARAARYAAFTKWLREGDLLLLAHHADDQAETLLYRLLRSGIASGMPALRPLGPGLLARPLLGFPRAALRAYAEGEGLRLEVGPEEVVVGDPLLGKRRLPHGKFAALWRRTGIVLQRPGHSSGDGPGR